MKKIVDKFRALFALFKLGWLMVLSLGLCFLYTINPHELYAQPKLVGVSSGPGSVFTIEPDSEKPGEWVNFGTLMNPGGSGTTGELTFAEGELYGMTKSGGSFNRGVIYKIDLDGTNLQTVAPFPIELRGSKSHQFYLDGKLWGTDNAFNKGTLYYLDLQDESINMVANFTDSTGLDPVSQLTLYDDKFWGITRRGGRSNKGTIYSVNSDGTDLQAVYHFSEVEGSGMGGITLSVYDGKMWGTSSSGGTNSSGFIFTYELSSEEFSIEHNFSPSDVGYSPDYGLVLYNDRLWGIMKSGGQSTVGGVYSIDPTDTVHSPKLEHSFGVEAGFDPNAGLLVGNMPQRGECLFGITAEGGDHWKGTIFIMDPDDGFIQTTSLGSEDFGSPTAGLTLANDKLYSMQQSLGAGFRGGLLALNLTNIQTERVYTSPREDLFGKSINTELFVTSTGHFIGVCSEGGKVGNGTIFSIDREGKNFTVLYDFPEESAGGILPKEIIEHKGRIFGVAFNGGNNDDGVIFSVDASGQFSVVHHFEREANGHFPELLTPFNGRIWGYTNSGGPNSEGVLYSLAEDGTDFKVEHAFGGSAGDGERPQGDLTVVGENLMGTTRNGGEDNKGTLFMVDAQNTYQKLYDYVGELDLDERVKYTEDKAWGITEIEPTDGFEEAYVLYSIDLTTYEFTTEVNWQFPEVDGEEPDINPETLFIYKGAIWGVFQDDEIPTHNFLWKYDPATSTVDTLHVFDNELEGEEPHSELIAYKGKLWGLTDDGGQFGQGTIYQIDEDGSNFRKVNDFASELGSDDPREHPLLLAKGISFLSVTSDSITYGDEFPLLEVATDGQQEFIFSNSNENVLEVSGDTVKILGVGASVVSTFHEETDYYFADSISLEIAIAKAPLTISVDSITRMYNEPNSVLTPKYDGLVYEEDASVFSTLPQISTDATQESEVGTYDISVSGTTADNYEITHQNGVLLIIPATQLITFDSLSTKFIDSEDFSLAATASSGLDVSYELSNDSVISITEGVASILGPGTVEITAKQAGTNNYQAAEEVSRTLVVQAFTTSLEESLELEGAIYPNPTNNRFQIQTDFNYTDVTLYDLEGRVVKRFSRQNEYYVENLTRGTYLIELRNSQQIKRGRLIVR